MSSLNIIVEGDKTGFNSKSAFTKFKDFMKKYPQFLHPQNSLSFVIEDEKAKVAKYNGCHFWSNFEIADLNFLRSEAYESYFQYLDKVGGFYYERWGDAPVHSIAAAMFLPIEKIHHFDDIGYYHKPFYNCPSSQSMRKAKNCSCLPSGDIKRTSRCYRTFMETRFAKPNDASDMIKWLLTVGIRYL
jgi:hypothetical protein